MVWGAFSGSWKSPLVGDVGDPEFRRGVSGRHYDGVLREELPPMMLYDTYIFMQDNAGMHRYTPI